MEPLEVVIKGFAGIDSPAQGGTRIVMRGLYSSLEPAWFERILSRVRSLKKLIAYSG